MCVPSVVASPDTTASLCALLGVIALYSDDFRRRLVEAGITKPLVGLRRARGCCSARHQDFPLCAFVPFAATPPTIGTGWARQVLR